MNGTRWGDTNNINMFDKDVEFDTTSPDFDYESEKLDIINFIKHINTINYANVGVTFNTPLSYKCINKLTSEIGYIKTPRAYSNNVKYLEAAKEVWNEVKLEFINLWWAFKYEFQAGYRFLPKSCEETLTQINLTLSEIKRAIVKLEQDTSNDLAVEDLSKALYKLVGLGAILDIIVEPYQLDFSDGLERYEAFI